MQVTSFLLFLLPFPMCPNLFFFLQWCTGVSLVGTCTSTQALSSVGSYLRHVFLVWGLWTAYECGPLQGLQPGPTSVCLILEAWVCDTPPRFFGIWCWIPEFPQRDFCLWTDVKLLLLRGEHHKECLIQQFFLMSLLSLSQDLHKDKFIGNHKR